MPRPRKPSDTKQSHLVIFRLDGRAYGPLKAKADSAGVRVNELARQLTCAGKHRLVIETSRRADPALLAALQRLGANLNQLTKLSHMRGYVSPKVEELCDEIRNVVFDAIADHEEA
jgi:hypothetical protein